MNTSQSFSVTPIGADIHELLQCFVNAASAQSVGLPEVSLSIADIAVKTHCTEEAAKQVIDYAVKNHILSAD